MYILKTMIFKICTQTLMLSNISYSIVTIFLSGALSLTAITFNRVIGIAMPRLANMLEMNRYIVYAILASIWIISLGTAVPTFNFRRFNVNFSNHFCMNTSQSIVLIFIRFFQILEFKDYTQFMCVEGEFLSKITTIASDALDFIVNIVLYYYCVCYDI